MANEMTADRLSPDAVCTSISCLTPEDGRSSGYTCPSLSSKHAHPRCFFLLNLFGSVAPPTCPNSRMIDGIHLPVGD